MSGVRAAQVSITSTATNRRTGRPEVACQCDRAGPSRSEGEPVLKKMLCVVTLLAFGATSGCAFDPSDPLSHRHALHWAQKRYSQSLRWGEIERASEYVDPEQR